MLFNSAGFLAFFPLVVFVYYFLKQRGQIYWLLLMSCVFYMWLIPNYLIILIATVLVDYFGGLMIERSSPSQKKLWLILSIVFTCLILFSFKYFNFFQANVTVLARFLGWNYSPSALNLILPVGLSFHTFQSLSYVFEVYKGRQKAERSFLIYFLYVMFFPQLVAGPIERPQQLLYQFHSKHQFDLEKIFSGLQLMVIGFFKKIVIADRLALLVNPTFNSFGQAPAPVLILSIFFFAFQIYCDFSGYSTIARGTARVLGFELMENFNRPYFSSSVTEFWRRWHISLSSWFRDYLYIPMGGGKKGPLFTQFNLMITFLVSGLWHGANWTYVIWGAINGVALLVERSLGVKSQTKLGIPKFKSLMTTFLIICLSWVFFRAATVSEATQYILRIFSGPWTGVWDFLFQHGISPVQICIGIICLIGLLIYETQEQMRGRVHFRPWAYVSLAVACLVFGIFQQEQFIYFQF